MPNLVITTSVTWLDGTARGSSIGRRSRPVVAQRRRR